MKSSCETCQNAKSCDKTIGTIWGFCNTDYEPQPTPTQTDGLMDFNDPWVAFFEPD